MLTQEGLKIRNQMVLDFAKKRNSPLVIFMGGGYSKPIHDTVNAFVDFLNSVLNTENKRYL
ncbi:hypothetical protein Ct9H90mP29_07060 [bacterium]|nr:MAG: hypothetical protein Ct9H90mP29_07060 [bacterium]